MLCVEAAMPSLNAALLEAQQSGLDRLDTQLLLLHALNQAGAEPRNRARNRAWLMAHGDDPLDATLACDYQRLWQRRAAGEPLAYITGTQGFFGLVLQVDERVLVPRADTETLVEWALACLKVAPATAGERLQFLDLGTGSGAVALAVAANAGPIVDTTAVDASQAALAVAAQNAHQLQLSIRWIQSDWFEHVSGHFHVIASNPPYIAEDDLHLSALAHEPLEALTAGTDGLSDLTTLIEQAPRYLLPGGWLLLEHGHDQAESVAATLIARGFVAVAHQLDLAGIRRCTGGQWPL